MEHLTGMEETGETKFRRVWAGFLIPFVWRLQAFGHLEMRSARAERQQVGLCHP